MNKRILFLVYSGLVLTLCFSSVVNASPNLLLGWLLQPQFKTVKLNPFYNNVLVNPGNVSVNGSLCLWNASVGGYWQCVSAWNQNVSINVTANLTYFYYPNQTSFLYLNDTPNSYAGFNGSCVVVNSTETGLTFTNCSTGSSGEPLWVSNYSNGLSSNWVPFTSGTNDLGNTTRLWNDLFMNGNLTDPTPTWGGSCSIKTACDVGDYSPWDYDSDFIYQKDTNLGVMITNLTVGDWFAVNTTITNDTVNTTWIADYAGNSCSILDACTIGGGGGETFNGTFNSTSGGYVYNDTDFNLTFNETKMNATIDSRGSVYLRKDGSTQLTSDWTTGAYNTTTSRYFNAYACNATNYVCLAGTCITNWTQAGNASTSGGDYSPYDKWNNGSDMISQNNSNYGVNVTWLNASKNVTTPFIYGGASSGQDLILSSNPSNDSTIWLGGTLLAPINVGIGGMDLGGYVTPFVGIYFDGLLHWKDVGGTHWMKINPGVQLADVNYTLPNNASSYNGQVLSCATNGSLSWVNQTPASAALPTGMIAPFYLSACPSGWVLANGSTYAATTHTPDLRDKFVIATGSGHAFNSTGGSTTYIPAGTIDAHTTMQYFAGSVVSPLRPLVGPLNHLFTGTPATIEPPYYSLIYCMKT
jgi:hypothetical protein